MLLRRVLAALVGGPVFLTLVYVGGWPLVATVTLLISIGLSEYARLARASGARIPTVLLAVAGLLPLLAGKLGGAGAAAQMVLVPVAIALLLPVFSGMGRSGGTSSGDGGYKAPPVYTVTDGAFFLLGSVYMGLLYPYILYLRAEGLYAVGLLIAATWVGDTAAYFAGMNWGRHPLLPKVSPKKTVEGAVVGLAGSAVAGALVAYVAFHPAWQGLVSGAVVGLVGQVGDLAESALKRYAGIKDSGVLIPGHGGVLDRFDSMVAAAPVLYYMFMWFGWGVR